MNQAFFKRVWVTEKGLVGWGYNEPFQTLMIRHGKPAVPVAEAVPHEALDFDSDGRSTYQRRGPGFRARTSRLHLLGS